MQTLYLELPADLHPLQKSFHGDAGNLISEMGVRSSLGGAKGQLNANQSNGCALLRQPQQANRKVSERQRNKALKPLSVSKNQSSSTKVYELGQDFSSTLLPEAGTASYRLTHDVSFDEGSRYRGSAKFAFSSYKPVEEGRDGTTRRKGSTVNHDEQRSSNANRLDMINDQSNRRPPTSHVQTLTFKEPITYTFLKVDDKRALARGISTPAGSPTCQAASPNGTPLRVSKDGSWGAKFRDLSVSGGGFYGASPIQPGARVDLSGGLNSLSVNSITAYSQKLTFRALSREKSGHSMKPRIPGRRVDSSFSNSTPSRDCVYADPFLGAPASFHQRLNELSQLEAETIKYEKSRKFKRKSKSDKDLS